MYLSKENITTSRNQKTPVSWYESEKYTHLWYIRIHMYVHAICVMDLSCPYTLILLGVGYGSLDNLIHDIKSHM